MQKDIYEMLREQLDKYSVGFPKTESGVEMKILHRLFTEEEANMYLNLTMLLEAPEAIAQRMGREAKDILPILECMFEKGLVFRLKRGDSVKYAAVPFVIGFYEFQLNRMDRELAQLFEQYFEETFSEHASRQTVPMRTIPVRKAISVSWPVAPYEDAREIIKQKDRIAVANCICRTQK
ncbi:MAG: 4Fe-4S ferredoxin, partial [Deltaproteobacteria bacterium]|nr:4Fe-4S ferredoxin [Deltaproteobacteria bacterium]